MDAVPCGKGQQLVPPHLSNPRGPGRSAALPSGPRTGRLSGYEDGDPASRAVPAREGGLSGAGVCTPLRSLRPPA